MQPHLTPSAEAAAADAAAGRKACDQCRLRKTRCDKDWPCSNCRTTNRTCTSTGAGQRPKEARQRVLISSQYEKKIDKIDARLGNIEDLLRNLSLPAAADSATFIRIPLSSSGIPTGASSADHGSSDDESPIGAETGLTAHTTFASELVERAVKRSSFRPLNPKMETALANLSQIVDLLKRRSLSRGPRFPLQQPIPPGGVTKLPMPPMATVVSLLRDVKGLVLHNIATLISLADTVDAPAGPPIFNILCTVVGISDITALCRTVYFATEDFSDATFAVVNAMLQRLFMEQQSLVKDTSLRDDYLSYANICRANLETVLANLPLFLSAKPENVQALLLGCLYANDVSRPSVSWHLITMAALLCKTGGYHRAECLGNESPAVAQQKTSLFWHVYMTEKVLSLRLGRASSITEYDIDIPRDFNMNGLKASFAPAFWIGISNLLGRIYEQLYSPAALAGPEAELVQRARLLADECCRLEAEASGARDNMLSSYLKSTTSTSDMLGGYLGGDKAHGYVMKTLIYRVIPAPEGSASRFCGECLEAARKAMTAHLHYVGTTGIGSYAKTMNMHWNLTLGPFAPFFVLFSYVIETTSLVDFQLLQDFIDSLEKERYLSEPIDKMYRLFRVMCDVATLYVEDRTEQQQDCNSIPMGNEFGMYLSQLGFMPMEDHATANGSHTDGAIPGNGQAAQIADWFAGSRDLIGLLEEDLPQMDSFRWMEESDAM